MGYTTDFNGKLKFNKVLSHQDYTFLKKLNETRRMARKVDPKYGVEGEFYVEGDEYNDPTIIDVNRPPSTQPGLWCQWQPTEDGWGLEWDGGEKFYNYVEWLEYLINLLAPKGYVLNGQITWSGEEQGDVGTIRVIDNEVIVSEGIVSSSATPDEIGNQQVWSAVFNALTAMGMKHVGGGDGVNGFEDIYEKDNYRVTIEMRN